MRDIYRNPMLYYLLAPVLVVVWPLLVWGLYLPRAERDSKADQAFLIEGQTYVLDILNNDPGRLEFAASNDVSGEFSYAKAIDRVANLCRIPPSKCDYGAGNIIPSRNKRSQQAKVTLMDVSIVQTATFLSTIQSMWVNLKCDKVKLTKKKEMPDQWAVDFTFWYYY